MENTKNTVFPGFSAKRIISDFPKCSKNPDFSVFIKMSGIKPDWVGLLVKMSDLRHVLDTPVGNTF